MNQIYDVETNCIYSRELLPTKAISRIETYLRELCLIEGSPLPIPQSRIEKLLNSLVIGADDYEEPQSRHEKLIHAIIIDDDKDVERCASRIEVLWYIILKGLDGESLLGTEVNGQIVEDCFSRIESYLWYLAMNGDIGSKLEYDLNNKITMYNTKSEKVTDITIEGNTMVNIVGDELSDNTYEVPALQSDTYTVQSDGSDFTLNGTVYSHGLNDVTEVNSSMKLPRSTEWLYN